MKKTTTVSETPVATAEKSTPVKATKKPVTKAVVAKAPQKASTSTGKTKAKVKPKATIAHEAPKTAVEVPVSKDSIENAPAAPLAKAAPSKASPKPKATKVAPIVEPEPKAAPVVMSMHERIGLTAGVIWHHLAENGATPVAKLVYVLAEDEDIIQRSIGWLAQEDKVTLSARGGDQVETIVLKG
ncbi:winged helix-turn-helix domain-containing protein [Methylomonas albis]|uniref:Winged helix-turn-helix domain-containing protein n=1 Tax=Methylomonas albis TaxID=1854563 RepID=A0ABR9D552_9GAMM|nr:winged helix-turn-helix domain-containing protein [Methylomonas albis]MBD9358244.1 winged helix-turn-helix domain-containing protein [Methylomonas albis]